MLLFVRGKAHPGADEKMLLRLGVGYEFLHSNKVDELERRVLIPEKGRKAQKEKKKIKHIMFDLNYMLEHEDTGFIALLERIKKERPNIWVTFYYYADDEYLISRSAERIREIGYTHFIVAADSGDYLKQLNTFIISNGLKPSEASASGCISIGVLGGCRRMGTTTQAVQMMMFLQKTGYRAGLIQWHSTPDLQSYVDAIQGAKRLNESEFVIKGLRFYGKRDVKTALTENDYLIFDFGNIEAIEQDCIDLFIEQDKQITVLGVKNSETHHITEILGLDRKGDFKYVYSFVLKAERNRVTSQAGERKKTTHFADYTPDYFTYSGNDAMYAKILAIEIPQKPPQKKIADIARTQLLKIRSGLWNKKTRKN